MDISAWKSLSLAEPIVNALKYYKFTQPTPIQSKTLPRALAGRDIIGAAETGSGKTLAFGIPMVQSLLKGTRDGLTGLVLTPTRELAIQVKDHIQNIATFTDIRVCLYIFSPLGRLIPSRVSGCSGRGWHVHSKTTPYAQSETRYHCCNPRSFLGDFL